MKNIFLILVGIIILFSSCKNNNSNVYIISDYGAISDTVTLNTRVIQKCIDKAHSKGGGTVVIPSGNFVTGTIFIKSNITLRIESGAVLLGSGNLEDYPIIGDTLKDICCNRHLIEVRDAENVLIEGKGTINGRGWYFWKKPENQYEWILGKESRPDVMLAVDNSKNVTIQDIHLVNPASWTANIDCSEQVFIRGININNNILTPNSDGIDISGSKDVIISDCYISTCDDGIVLNTCPGDVERITVNNCNIRTLCAAIKAYSGGKGKLLNQVAVTNCNIWGSNRAIAVYSWSDAIIQNIVVNNIIFESNAGVIFSRPIQIDLQKLSDSSHFGIIRNITITNFTATTQGRILVTAEKGSFIENLTLRNIKMEYPYFESLEYLKDLKSSQASNQNPDARMARAAIVAENVKNLFIDDVQIKWPEKNIPEKWKIKVKIENGSMKLYEQDYSNPRPVEFSVFWGKGIDNAYIHIPLAQASSAKTEKYNIQQSKGIVTK